MVAHFEFFFDQLAYALQCPAIGCKSTRQSATIQLPFQFFFLHITQLRFATWCFLLSETSYACCFHDLSPITDRCSADTQVPSDLRLGHLAFFQQTTTF